jgi:aryl-alcohol dehydrogenase-like predicted oxidoreductase
MDYRVLGRTGLGVSVLGFGCGTVGGLMIRSAPADRERAVARAIELGINYFDTAPSYGDGQSETNLGAVLKALRARVYVGTKFRLSGADLKDAAGAIAQSLEASLARLGRDGVDLFQLHNHITPRPGDAGLTAADVLERVIPALEKLREQGKTRFYGVTALGDTDALHEVVGSGRLHTAQVCYNLLNPSAGTEMPRGLPAQDFRRLIARAHARGVGVIVIRVLAAGALSGTTARHPVAVPSVEPIATGPSYAADVRRARALQPLVDEGHAASLPEASLRFAIGHPDVSTVLLGYSDLAQLEAAAAAVTRGPLAPAALQRVAGLWDTQR